MAAVMTNAINRGGRSSTVMTRFQMAWVLDAIRRLQCCQRRRGGFVPRRLVAAQSIVADTTVC
jgi:hypothetical protein